MDPTQPPELQEKIAQIAQRYLDRVPGEVEKLQEMIGQAASGNADILGDLEALAHRIHGGGAMLRFEEISDRAGVLEQLAHDARQGGNADIDQMRVAHLELTAAVARAVTQRAQSQAP
jgi:HPt (histidine-containing phosphotransfer) domain-containing protein